MRWRGISTESTPDSYLPLAVQLQTIRENTEKYVAPATLAIHERAIAQLRGERIAERALQPGSPAPQFSLLDQHSTAISSTGLLKSGKLAIVFFRGRWCPYCVTQLESLQFLLPQFRERNIHLVAISPQKPHHNFLTADQHKLRFPLLSDEGNAVAAQFGIRYTVPPEQAALYRSVFVNLPHLNNNAPDTLPLPATFLISQNGIIERAHTDPDFRVRPEPADLLS